MPLKVIKDQIIERAVQRSEGVSPAEVGGR
jgi:hypothetical protein